MGHVTQWQPRQLELIRRTVAKDTTAEEFDQFCHICRHTGLDPLRRQIYCFVFGKDNPKYRQMTVVTAIGGYRSIAARTGRYRADDRAPRYAMCEKSATNPLGIERCEVTVFSHMHGEWHAIVGEAWWDEYAPIYDGRLDAKKAGWIKMPRIMIAKCAEAQALRRAWPDDLSGLYAEEELDRQSTLDLSATEIADGAATTRRLSLVGGEAAITIDWLDGKPFERVSVGTLGDRALEWVGKSAEEPGSVQAWADRNRHALREYWARDPAGCLAVRAAVEKIVGSTGASQ